MLKCCRERRLWNVMWAPQPCGRSPRILLWVLLLVLLCFPFQDTQPGSITLTGALPVFSSLGPEGGTSGRTNSAYPSDHELPSEGVTSFLVMKIVSDIFIYRLQGLLR